VAKGSSDAQTFPPDAGHDTYPGTSAAFTQRKPDLAGDFLGSLAPLHLKLHLASKPGGSLTGSLDSINQGAIAYDPALPGSPIYLANTSPRDSRVKPQSRCRAELASVSSMLAQKLLAWMLPSEDRLFIQRFDP
jgi:hypothetical protein